MAKKANVSTTEEGEDDVADVTKSELKKVDADRQSGNKPTASSYRFKGVQDWREHPDWTTFRTDVENTAAGDLNWPPKEPYPTGNPPTPESQYAQIHGRLPGDDNTPKVKGARDEPKPQKGD
jgi:hypothetical protein